MLANTVLLITWLFVTAYVIFGGADFGAGSWDLLAGNAHRGAKPRSQLERSIGPVWEANHIWLIFVLVFLWTAFPTAFVSIMTTMYIPVMLAGLGIVLRGSAFAFRKWGPTLSKRRIMGVTFAASSFLTPLFLGAVAGGVASGRVPLGNARGDPWTSWVNPTSALGGVLAVVVCAYMAAVLVSRDSIRTGDDQLAGYFRRRAFASGVVAGVVALGGVQVIRTDAPVIYEGLTEPLGILLIAGSAVFGVASLVAIASGRTHTARVVAVIAVSAVVWGWAVGQYPWLLPTDLTIEQGAAPDLVLTSLIVAFVLAGLIAVPALVWLFLLTERGVLSEEGRRSLRSTDTFMRELAASEDPGSP